MTEAQAWRKIAKRCDATETFVGLYAAVDDLPEPARGLADRRLRLNDDPTWHYGTEDHFADMAREDRILACLFLALEAEDEARSAQGVRE